MLARFDYEKALRKQEGERSERDFASAMGATATQERALKNAHPTAAAPTAEQWEAGRTGQKAT